MNRSQWYVITGTFSSGKTTLLQALAEAGHRVIPEVARMIIDEDAAAGKPISEIRADEAAFERRVLARKIQVEASLPSDQMLFLDRAMPDSIAYHQLLGLDFTQVFAACQKNLYGKVFCLEPLGFVQDYARTESVEAMVKLHDFLQEAYTSLGYEMIMVRPMSSQARLKFVLERL